MSKISEIELFISEERAKTYLDYFSNHSYTQEHKDKQAYKLYLWNIQMSGALLEIFSFYEVSLRNAILKRLNHYHHSYGIFDDDFIRSLGHKVGEYFVETINKVYPNREPYVYTVRNKETIKITVYLL